MKKQKQVDVVEDKLQPKKINNQKLVNFIWSYVSVNNLELISECSTFNKFIATFEKNKKKLVRTNSCKNRFCSICSYRKSQKDGFKIGTLLEVIRVNEKKEFIFLTLTTPNIKGYEVHDMIDHFNKSFELLMKRKQIKNVVRGYIRKLEMTYNANRNDYNPHFHVLLVVDKSYFTNPRQYIKHKEWLDLWREVTGMEEITQVDVRKVNTMRGNAVAEVAKYSAKDSEMLLNEDVFNTFYRSLKGKRLLVYSGLFKEYSKMFDNDELSGFIQRDKTDYFYLNTVVWDWKQGKYVQAYRELTEEEKVEYSKSYTEKMSAD